MNMDLKFSIIDNNTSIIDQSKQPATVYTAEPDANDDSTRKLDTSISKHELVVQ